MYDISSQGRTISLLYLLKCFHAKMCRQLWLSWQCIGHLKFDAIILTYSTAAGQTHILYWCNPLTTPFLVSKMPMRLCCANSSELQVRDVRQILG
jgi:hypothetical protein